MERIALLIDGILREYLVAWPNRTAAPLIVFLHGMGATAAWADEETGWSALAARAGFALALPEALRPDPTLPPKFLTNPQRWNDGAVFAAVERPQTDDVAFVAAVIDDVRKRAQIDDRRIYVSGFSNGAAMVFRLAAELADRIAAIAPVAGYCWVNEAKLARPVPTLYMIGSLDPLVPIRGGDVRSPWKHRFFRRPPIAELLDRWARAIGCQVPVRTESETAMVRTDVYPGPVQFRVMTIEGLGHHWPGGRGGLNPKIAGPPRADVDGTELVWEFLRQQSL